MAKGRFSLDEKIHTELVEGAPKIRQAEWAKLLAWMPVAEGMKRWTSTVLLAIVAAGSSGMCVRLLSGLLNIPINHMYARLVILKEFGLVTTYYSDGIIYFRQNLVRADWPPWMVPPVWALDQTPTKSTVKRKPLFTVMAGKVHKVTHRIDRLVKFGVHKLATVTEYHIEQAKKAELQENREVGAFQTKSKEIQQFDTGFKSVESQKKLRTGTLSTKSVKKQVTTGINNRVEVTRNKKKLWTGTDPIRSPQKQTSATDSKPVESQRKRELGLLRFDTHENTHEVKEREKEKEERKKERSKERKKEEREKEIESQQPEKANKNRRALQKRQKIRLGGTSGQTLLDMVSEDNTRQVSTVRATPSRRREVQGWQSKGREDWYGLDLLGYFLHRWRRYYGEEDPVFVDKQFSLKDQKNIFRKANYRLQSFDKRFFRAKGDGAAYLDWLFDTFLPESDWLKDALLFVQVFKLSENNFFYARFLQRGVKPPSGPGGKKGTWHHWGFEEA